MTVDEFLANPPTEPVMCPDPILLKPCEAVTDFAKIEQVGSLMIRLMREWRGCGLAANQVGLSLRLFVVHDFTTGFGGAFANPGIETEGPIEKEEESCLSIPGTRVRVPRPRCCTMVWQNPKTREWHKSALLGGRVARMIQHEVDHLNGVTILDRGKVELKR